MPRFAVIVVSFDEESPLSPGELYTKILTKEPTPISSTLSFYKETLKLEKVSLFKSCCSGQTHFVVALTQLPSDAAPQAPEEFVVSSQPHTMRIADTGLLPDECFAAVEISLDPASDPARPVLTLTRDPIGRKSLMYASLSDNAFVATSGPAADGTLAWTEAHPRFKTAVSVSPTSVNVEELPGDFPTLSSWYGERAPTDPAQPSPTENEMAQRVEGYVDPLIKALEASVQREAVAPLLTNFPEERKIAVLFSGGLDSTVLAAVVDRCLPPEYTIELVNVAFTSSSTGGRNKTKDMYTAIDKVPDRIAGLKSLEDLRAASTTSPPRNWVFVPVDVTEEEANSELQRILGLARPRDTYMDVTIGLPIWFAGRGIGSTGATSSAHVLVVGQGADEQFAGYTRYRSAFNSDGVEGMQRELNTDMERLWSRNLGRDDRILTDRGRLCALPFLSRQFVSFLNSIPLDCICDLSRPQGVGDKLLLRMAAKRLGLEHASKLAKKAIQFGSRVAKLFKMEGVTSKQARSCGAAKFERKDDD